MIILGKRMLAWTRVEMIRVAKDSEGYILKRVVISFANRLNVGCEGSEESRIFLHPIITLLKYLMYVFIAL